MMTTYVYVSSAEDGEICAYTLRPDGSLAVGARVKVQKGVMPMAVSPDKRFIVAAIRGEQSNAASYSIDAATGALNHVATAPLVASLPYIWFDRTGRYLLGASYSANLVCVNTVGVDGHVGEAIQVIPTARNAHCIRTDNTGRFVFAPHLGTDQIFQFKFDEKAGRLTANTPPLVQLEQGCGPRHLLTSPDNRFVFVLCELTADVLTLALDAETGLLSEIACASALPADTKLVPGAPRGPNAPARDVSNDIWASDIHITPDGKFLYTAERTKSTISTLSIDCATGNVTYLRTIDTEAQPRGFRIDPSGRFMIVSGEKSGTISAYAIDASSGELDLVGKYAAGRGSNWVEIVSF